MLRSHAIWCEDGVKSTKYFLSLEKRNYKNKRIDKLGINNITLTDIETIIQEEKEYYQSLYKSSQENVLNNEEFSNFLNNLDVPRLSDNEALECEGAITETECSKILTDLKVNKTPESDGFQVEFYNFFWPEIKDLVLESINYSVVKNRMSNDQRKGVITLVPKKDKDKTNLKNWRPISLLNFDYKIVSKVLANRVIGILPKLIDSDQTGYIRIGENIRTISDPITLTNLKKTS